MLPVNGNIIHIIDKVNQSRIVLINYKYWKIGLEKVNDLKINKFNKTGYYKSYD
jgi:hypothetical protein